MAQEDLRLDRLLLAYPGDARYALSDYAEAMPLGSVLREIQELASGPSKLGKDLFGADDAPPADLSATYKRSLKTKLRAKHRR